MNLVDVSLAVSSIAKSLQWRKSGDVIDRYKIINDMVQGRGFNLIGQGNFSDFYTNHNFKDIGFKVGTKKEDSASAYIAWCRQNQHRAGVPKVYDIQRQEKNGMYVVAMKLYNNHTEKHEIKQSMLWRNIHDIITMEKTPKYRELRTLARIARIDYQSFYEINKKFIFDYMRTMLEIRKFFIGIAMFDVHDGNYVFDENMLPVMIDPISFQRKDRTKRYDTTKQFKNQAVVRQVFNDDKFGEDVFNLGRNGRFKEVCNAFEHMNIPIPMPQINVVGV